ncbi:quinol:cytochrome C oxidoreductase [Tenacibaculum jejuense]|uniref:Quinol:cytochrome C oxidoreductase n=1 Tax=Tenacibaculum jejuense TaxID=584609 RepID=A0A238U843_9FLAO|nr:quinol:cytochrome C oxidoreductase [Tenacibaculum jejuense]SNR14570.1 conserved membrane protein of unknown function [Tenacibaculum jejuense]
MYQFSGKLKMLAIGLMVIGLIGTAISFMNTPKTLQDAKDILAKQEASHHGSHGGGHGEATNDHHANTEHKSDTHKSDHKEVKSNDVAHTNDHKKEVKADSLSHKEEAANHAEDTRLTDSLNGHVAEKAHVDPSSHAGNDHDTAHHGDDHEEHAKHAFHQMQNKPWSAIYVSLIFFLGISLLVMAFYAAQRVAHAGWSVVLFRVMEAITANLHYVSAIMLVFIIVTAMHMNHLFPWMADGVFDPLSENYDPIIDGKKWFMNLPGWVMRSVFYLLVWNGFRFYIRKKSIEQDNGDLDLHKKIYNVSVVFILLFMITESMMSWDWIMGIDPHWFSTLFGWYVLATLLVSALTVICLVTLYLRSKGHLPFVNDSHIHDLAKFMFGFSVFWTYLWFAQFMLIWYADMPEETTYFALRFKEYVVPFIGMIALNFIFPILLLINSDFKTVPWVIVIAGVFILVGHYVDLFVMIMPGTVGAQWGFGIGEISAFLFFLGLFIFATFNAFAKANPVVKGNPFLHESEIHHYYIIEHRGEDNAHH